MKAHTVNRMIYKGLMKIVELSKCKNLLRESSQELLEDLGDFLYWVKTKKTKGSRHLLVY